MKIKKSFLGTAALALAVGIPATGLAQLAPQTWGQPNYGYQQRDFSRDRDDSAIFRKGLKDGRKDANHRRAPRPDRKNKWRERDDRQAYARGYWQGYNSVRQGLGWGDGDRD